MQEYKPTTIQLKSFAENTLTYHEEIAMQTLVVNLPSREMPKMPSKSFLQQVRLTKKMKYPN
jgi:hypothetical protein